MPFMEKPQNWKDALLTASVVLNVFFIGFLAARALAPSLDTNSRNDVELEFTSLPEGMPSHAREELENRMRSHQEELSKAYTRMQEVQDKIGVMVSEGDFEEGELEAAFTELHELEEDIKGPIQAALIAAMQEVKTDVRRNVIREERRGAREVVRETIRDRRSSGRRALLRHPNRVDGSRWKFSMEDGHFELDIDGLKELDNLSGLVRLGALVGNLEELRVLESLEGLESLENLEGLGELAGDVEFIILREIDGDGDKTIRLEVIKEDGEEDVLIEVTEDEDE